MSEVRISMAPTDGEPEGVSGVQEPSMEQNGQGGVMTQRLRYNLTREEAEAAIRKLAADPPSADKTPWDTYFSDTLMLASPSASYRLTFQAGGATAQRSLRSDRWRVIYGVG
mgnify:CR=1 FL=1